MTHSLTYCTYYHQCISHVSAARVSLCATLTIKKQPAQPAHMHTVPDLPLTHITLSHAALFSIPKAANISPKGLYTAHSTHSNTVHPNTSLSSNTVITEQPFSYMRLFPTNHHPQGVKL
jgi:hypothetical protein